MFGLMMLVIDFPKESTTIHNFKVTIFHYALFMTRFCGRGLWYTFLSAMIVGSLWDNGICPPLGFIMGGFVFAVGGYAIWTGWKLSKRLEHVREKIIKQGPEEWQAYIAPNGMSQ